MAVLTWDETGERLFETGVSNGVLYTRSTGTQFDQAEVWNGLVSVTEAPSGAEPSAQYADNMKYVVLTSAEEFGGTIEAFTYPDTFAECDGSATPAEGVSIGQQPRKTFGLSYRTLLGNDVEGQEYGYKIHLVYGALAAPSEKQYSTVNDSPEPLTFSWEFSTTPVSVPNYKPTALVTVDSTKATAAGLAALEAALYGDEAAEAYLPTPAEVLTLLAAA